MKKTHLFMGLIFLLIIILPLAGAVIEEDWGNYTRTDESKRNSAGENIALSWLRKSYTNAGENYTVRVKDFDAQGTVVLVISYKGRNETIWLSGTWNENRTKIILPEPVEAFDKTMIITPIKIVAPAGVFTCCPEAEIKINLIRPELFLEFNEDTETNNSYRLVNPYADWNISVDSDNPYKDPFDNASIKTEKYTVVDKHNAYGIYDEIPMQITVTNYGDAEAQNTALYIYTDGLVFENGKPYYQLPTLGGKDQNDSNGQTNQTISFKLKFPPQPNKLSYTVHAYVKGEKNNNIYYYDDNKVINILPSIGFQKSVTKESMLIDRKDIEKIYPSIDSDEITRWLQSRDTLVTLGVTNYQNYEIKNVKLHDALQKQFIVENNSLNWTFDLKPRETKEFTYQIVASSPGKFSLPPALLTYSDLNLTWNLASNKPTTEVHGPCIQLFKKPDKPVITTGNNTNITITLRNSGDMPSVVTVNDSLPENSTLLEGQMYYGGRIMPKESAIFSYMISMDHEGQVELPNPKLSVNGKESPVCGELLTSRILVQNYTAPEPVKTIFVPKETSVKNQDPVDVQKTPLVKYSWLEGVIPAFMLLLAIIVLYMLYRKNI